MSRCVVCGAELEPPVRVPHTVYVKSLYRIGGDFATQRISQHTTRGQNPACPNPLGHVGQSSPNG